MAASEPPEPPPRRNPDKINATLNQCANDASKHEKSLETDQQLMEQKSKMAEEKAMLPVNISTTTAPAAAAATGPTTKTTTTTGSTKVAESHNDDKNGDENEEIATLLQKSILDDEINELDSPQSSKLKSENIRLAAEISRLKRLLEISPDGAASMSDTNSCDTSADDNVERLKKELRVAKEQILQLKNDRKKLRNEKTDLLAHVKQLGQSLQDKEQELRDFIRNYELRLRDTESSTLKTNSDRERERWSLVKQAREETERSLALAAKLNARDMQLQRTQDQLQEARRQLSGFMSDGGGGSSSGGGGVPYINNGISGEGYGGGAYRFNDRISDLGGGGAGDASQSDGACDNGICINMDSDSISIVSGQHMPHYVNQRQRSPTLSSPMNAASFSQSMDNGHLSSRSTDHLGHSHEPSEGNFLMKKLNKHASTLGRSTSRGGTWGSISKVFGRTKSRRNPASQHSDTESVQDFQWNPNEEGYAEKLKLLRDASNIPMDKWRASQVVAWLDVVLGMPQYSVRCNQNVKSGKVLLELNDVELEAALAISHPMHRKKLRLAIEEHRRPELMRYPAISQLGHTWVASEWLPDIGLPQYIESFMHCLVDARMLDTLSKKELEKMLGVTRKFHQASIVHGIHVLRLVRYDRQELAMRRHQSENVDSDPIVWTNQRFVKWVRSIDLGEYADNLKDSGVHGGFVLEPSFTGETMATALGIPSSKNIIRRHLAAEFDNLVLPARYFLQYCSVSDDIPTIMSRSSENELSGFLGQGIRSGSQVIPITGPGGLQHYGTVDRKTSRFGTWKGSQNSLSKVFSFNKSSTSPTPSYSSSEGYAPIGAFFIPPPPPPTNGPPATLPSQAQQHRVSAPVPISSSSSMAAGAAAVAGASTSSQHRRVKSISDIASPGQ